MVVQFHLLQPNAFDTDEREEFMDANYYDQKYAEIPHDYKLGAVQFLRDRLPEVQKQLIRELFQKDGHDWIHNEAFGHFYWGMGCRNQLRNAGFKDEKLPDGNLDDYYVSLVEAACGLRE